MRVLIAGAGAVGSVFGARLALVGHPVELVARGPQLAALREHGLRVEGTFVTSLRVRVFSEPPSEPAPELILVACKAFDLEALSVTLARRLRPSLVLAIQNGLGVRDRLWAGLRAGGWTDPSRWATQAITTVPATLVAPGLVRQAGEGEVLLPGRSTLPPPPDGLDGVVDAFRVAGIPCRRVDDFERQVWRKVLVNAAVNPVTADHGIANGRLTTDPWRGQALQLLLEARAVAEAEGVRIPPEEAEEDLFRVVRATAENRSSMLQDLDRGRPTEIEAISGELVRLGRSRGLELPATVRVLNRIRARSRSPGGRVGPDKTS